MQDNKEKNGKIYRKKLVILLFLVLVFLMGAMIFIASSVLNSNKIYRGVYVGNVNLGNVENEQQVGELVNTQLIRDIQKKSIVVKADNQNVAIELGDIKMKCDAKGIFNDAFKVGRKGNVLKRVEDIVMAGTVDKKIKLSCSYDERYVKSKLNELYEKSSKKVEEISVEFEGETAIFKAGKSGKEFDKDLAFHALDNKIKGYDTSQLIVDVLEKKPKKATVDDLYSKILSKPKNATIALNGVKEYGIKAHILGRDIEKSSLEEVVKSLNEKKQDKVETKVKLQEPKITTGDLKSKIFKDQLITFTTDLGASSGGRITNIRIAASKIDGVIVPAGGTFSFEKIVGDTLAEEGYQPAPTILDGELVDSFGGGVCQLSTTIHNCILRDPTLEIVERTNHSWVVGYSPAGYDAAISYGSLDYKFKNNYDYPVKLKAGINGGGLTVSVYGFKQYNKSVELSTEFAGSISPKDVYKDDPALKKGEEVIKAQPKNGSVVHTYRKVTEAGKVLSSGVLYTSTYSAQDRIIRRGTGG